MIQAILFDLDGTLLPMDQDVFVKHYFGLLAKKLAPLGYDSKKLVAAIWKGTAAMVGNDGSKTNEAVFWQCFSDTFGPQVLEHAPVFEDYYRNEFQAVRNACGFATEAGELISWLKGQGKRLYLATNPIFPRIATLSRIRWAGLQPEDFEGITTYENSRHCKPNPDYYRDILDALKLQPEECIMVGNDVSEDMVAEALGMQVFLLTDCLINKEQKDISVLPHGGFHELRTFLETALG
ncbi:MAG: HAD family hydrolase [Oscillospiraceae bacterium]|nr:HAD family hydrolase [Oscillospiraceae bacterium]